MEWYRNLDANAEVKLFWNENLNGSTREYLNHSYEMFLVDGPDLMPIAGYKYKNDIDNIYEYPNHVLVGVTEVKAHKKPEQGRWVESNRVGNW